MKKIVLGILAHVDAGKTTLSEAMLFTAGEVRKMGRVDHRDAFLDTEELERERGITIFSKQAIINTGKSQISLLDTPGHIDFSAETERALWAIDYAVLVISATEGIQGHTETLWRLLAHKSIPVFVFVNKMDVEGTSKIGILKEMNEKFGDGFIDFTDDKAVLCENVAMYDEEVMHSYLETEEISTGEITSLVAERKIFPCFFGSALKLEGVSEFLSGIEEYSIDNEENTQLGARVFKITEDEKGNRLSHMRISGGTISVRDKITCDNTEEKITEIRIYSGNKYKSVNEATQGDVCAVCGLDGTYSGLGIGFEQNSDSLTLEPVFSYKLAIKDGTDTRVAFAKLKKLEMEETQLKVSWNEAVREINILLMGEIQLEVLKRILEDRFDLKADFEQGSIVYKETISAPVEGVGHFEHLRHYAEVHLLLEPLERGKGIVFDTDCSEDDLGRNWQRLILTHLAEKRHIGVLTGSAITDIKITLKSGKAHLKHTEGGDFRQATYRAVRHGLRCAENVLLEPYYSFLIVLPCDGVGRAMTDLEQMGARISSPESNGEIATIRGSAPVSKIGGYQRKLTAYTRGTGRITMSYSGYEECKEADEVISLINYDCDADLDNTADSVFCAHGAGFTVNWRETTDYMHLESIFKKREEGLSAPIVKRATQAVYDEDELIRIFEKTYGKIVHKNYNALRTPKETQNKNAKRSAPPKIGPEYLLIDGYNIIFASEKMKKTAAASLEDAREQLIERICNYKIFHDCEIILVFDAYKIKGNQREVEKRNNISIVYTKEAETADAYIEKVSHTLGKKHRVRVASSDGLEQLIILGSGAERVPATSFLEELDENDKNIAAIVEEYNQRQQ